MALPYGNQTDRYVITDEDDSTPTSYFGYLQGQGSWYILQKTTSGATVTYRYTSGSGGSTTYATNWTSRASLSYDYYSNIFKE